MNKYDALYMDIAWRCSEQSYAERLKVGCVIVKEESIISYGWNGMPAGFDNECEEHKLSNIDGNLIFHLKTKPEVSHAEMNALGKIASSNFSAEHAILYCTHSPCIQCAKLIQRSGIKELIYNQDFRSDDGLILLKKRGIKVRKF